MVPNACSVSTSSNKEWAMRPSTICTVLTPDLAASSADHVNLAVGEVDHADDAVDHRVADRDQRIDRTQTQAIDELLGKLGKQLIHLCLHGKRKG